jgi:hypothetical protein
MGSRRGKLKVIHNDTSGWPSISEGIFLPFSLFPYENYLHNYGFQTLKKKFIQLID